MAMKKENFTDINSAQWITSGMSDTDRSIYFRKEFDINEEVLSATLDICALGLGVYTINGQRVCNEELCTPFTKYDARVIYQSYDVTKLLVDGKNAIGVHIGNGFYNNNMTTWNDVMSSWRDCPKLIACLTVRLKSGELTVVKTDTKWRCVGGDRTYNHMRQGEICDARLTQLGFDMPNFNDSGWNKAVIAREPGGVLEKMDMPPIRVTGVIKPTVIEDGLYDFGVNISGRAKIKVSGESGREIHLIYDEALKPGNRPLGDVSYTAMMENARLTHENIFICSGREDEEFAPIFCYHGFRYVWVENAPKKFEIVADIMHTDLEKTGDFVCSDETLNRLHEMSVRSTLTNYFGIPTDCPHREQNGWTGDASLSSDQSFLNFDMEKVYTKWMNDFKDAQRPSGQLPGIIPSSGWGYNGWGGPAWDSAVIVIPWNFYIYKRSTKLIESMWDNMVRYVKYMQRVSENYIVNFGLGDWCSPVKNEMCPPEVTDTAYFYHDALLLGKMADLIGKDSTQWYELAENVKREWRNKFLNNSKLEKFQTYWACAAYQGLLNEDEKKYAADRIVKLLSENDYHIDCGILGTKYIFTVLSENGYMSELYKMVTNPTCPSYAYWIGRGMTTFCEKWEIEPSSRNHHMFSEVDNWFYRYIGGIKFTEDGLVIEPKFFDDVSDFSVSHNGISVEYVDKKILRITTDTDAKVILNGEEKMVSSGSYEYLL